MIRPDCWLTIGEAAAMLGVSSDTVLYRIRYGRLRALWLTPALVRIPTADLLQGAPSWPSGLAGALTAEQVADLLHVHNRTVRRLAGAGVLPARLLQGRWSFHARTLRQWAERRLTEGARAEVA